MEKRAFEYNNKKYEILIPSVRQSMPLCNRVAVLLSPLVSTLTLDKDKGGLAVFGAALQKADPIAIDKLFMDAVAVAKLHCNGNQVNSEVTFEQHFGENRGDVYPVCGWVLWECVKDFFPQLEAFVPKAKAAAEKAFQSQMDGEPIGG